MTSNQEISLEGISERGSARISARAPWRRARATRPERGISGCLSVSRGYSKIKEAAKAFNFNFRDKTVLDIGSSTGGFTQYALDRGAKKVIAVEKGTNQMAKPLRYDPRVELHEKTDIFDFKLESEINVVVADVSFISLKPVLKYVKALKNADYLVMLKPQFEARPDQLTRGVVKNDKIRREIIKNFEQWLKRNGFIIKNKHDNELTGKHGNLERFYYLAQSNS